METTKGAYKYVPFYENAYAKWLLYILACSGTRKPDWGR